MSNERIISATSIPQNVPALVKKIDKTTFVVRVHFSASSKESMEDKIKRMLKSEAGRR